MKKFYIFWCLVVVSFITNFSFAQSDIYESYAILDVNGNGNTYYDLNVDTGNPDFEGTNLGTFIPSNSLVLNGAQNQTYKCGTHNILNSYIDYRIYLSGNTPPAFIASEILFNSDDGTSNFCTNTSIDQTWESSGANINVLNGLVSGDYILEVYTRSDADYNGDNISDNTYYISNSGANYKATFRVDNPPTALCSIYATQLDSSGNVSILATEVDGGSSDDFGIASMTVTPNSFNCGDIGNNTVTLTVTDTIGQTSTCIATVFVQDTTNPTALCQNATVVLDASGNGSITTADINNGSNDACGIQSLSLDQTSFDCNDIGNNTVTLTVTDNNGNVSTCTAIVDVQDTTNPTALCQNATVVLDASGNGSITTADINNGSNDACGIQSLSLDQTSFDCNDIGNNTVTLTVTDNNGNVSTCTAIVDVQDTTNPTALCQNTTVVLDASGNGSITTADINNGSNDACGIQSLSLDQTSFDCNDIGNNTVTLTVTDNNGNVSTCTAIVDVQDTTNPTALCQNATVVLDASGNGSITTADINNGSNDACGIQSLSLDQTSFDCNDIGNNTVTLTVTDNNGNVSTCTAIVDVQDTTNPTALCQNTTVVLDASGNGSITTADINNGSNDACGIQSLSLDQTSFDCNDIGNNTVTLTVTDNNGNVSTCTAIVDVQDTTNPTALCQNTTVVLDASGNGSITTADINNGSNDACGIQSLSLDQTSFDCNDIGNNTVTLTVTDNNGNVSTCTAIVDVQDTTNPTALCQNATVVLDALGNGSITTADINNGSNDACGIQSLSLDQTSFDCNDIGNNTVTLTVTDNNGNVSTCTAIVDVQDTTNPTALCQNTTVVLDASGNGSITTADINNGSNDACGIQSLSLDQTSFDCNDIGNNTVTLTVTDNNGNVSTCTAIVDVQDTTNPTIPTLPIITGQCSATVPTPTITDICSGTITGTTSDALVYTTQGSFAITWNFDDGNGNSINVVQNVVINDTIDPTPLCQDITIQLDDTTGTATITGAQIDNGSTDNCGSVNFTLSQSTFDCTNIGSNIIVLTVDDGNGNSAICTSNVTVTSPNITGGTVLGYLNNNQTIADEDNLVEVTACPDEPQNATINLYGHTGNVAYWEYSLNGGLTWTTVANTSTSYYYPNILETTLVRAVIQIGSCQANSSIAYVVVIPPDVPPTIIGPNTFTTCLGEDITVEAESSFGVNPDFNNGGMFNEANLNNLGWTVDGAAEMSAGGNNTSNTYWKLTNGPKKFNGRCFDSPDGNKFAVVSGIPPYDNPDHTITPLSTLETSTFNTLGLASALLEFDQAYFLEAGAWLLIELSLDGGATYPITLDPGAAYDYTGPSDTGFVNGQSLGFGGQCRNSQGTLVDNHVIVDLQNYIGLTNLRIKFTYSGTSNSVWALENIIIPQAPVDEVIEWEDGTGTVVTTGSITTISPVTPGIQTYGVTSLINGCRADGDEGTEFISVDASLAYAGENITQLIGECGEEVSLNAYDNDLTAAQNISNGVSNPAVFTTGTYPGTQEAGVWSATAISGCGSNYVFSDISSPRTKFSAEPGTYELTWSIPSVGCSDTIEVTIESCPTIDFDGNNDYITFENNYNLSNQFSIEAWLKPESISGTQTIFSKRNANDLSTGYDLRLVGNIIQFTWNASGVIQSSYPLTTDRWFHIAVVNSSGTYRLYVDGIEVSNPIGGSAPSVNTMKSLIGGMDQIGNASSRPVNYYDGWVDELRIWNTALSTAQIRQMMNQEIYNNTAVRGEIVPLDIAGLTWANLDGYYQMDVNCGYLSANAGNIRGQLRNMNSIQPDSAPLPYTSRVDGQEWNTDNTWTNFNVWDAPNSIGIDGITPIDWNIVQTSHHIESGNKDITVLGLISDTANKELKISDPSTTQDETNDGQALRVTHYLELDGSINLVGESQLIQDEGSILDQDSGGFLERDQQGTASSFHYNYWSSSVNPTTSSGIGQRGSGIPSTNANYSVNEILFDGTNVNAASAINFQTPFTAADGPITSPITVSSYWMFTFNGTNNDYYAWSSINANSSLVPGEGYTMKGVSGTEAIATPQNYVFRGKPNNGDISLNVGSGNNRLIGNPYASSIDAYEFILDNTNENGGRAPTNIINGALYFWDHFSGGTHLLEEYVGGYATYTRMGGVKAISNDIRINNNNAIGTKEPSRYIALNQGFFVSTALDPSISGTTASVTGGNVTFKNSQRIFKTEGSGQSVMFRNANTVDNSDEDQREKLRLMFDSPSGYHRQLLVGVELGTSLGFDLGFDAPIIDINDEDMFWNFNDTKYVIQAIDNFDSEQILPLGLIVNQEGICTIKIDELENISDDKTIFIFDQELGVYHNLRTSDFEVNLAIGDYFNRFFVTFSSEDTLSTSEEIQSQTIINYLNASHEIYVKTNNVSEVKKISLINILGQEIQIWNRPANYIVDSSIRIPVKQLSEGTYIIKVQTNNSTFNSKVVIKH